MPDFLIRNNDYSPRYAHIDEKKHVTWRRQAEGTPFGSEKLAWEAFCEACAHMWSIEVAKALKSQTRRFPTDPAERSEEMLKILASRKLPQWLTRSWTFPASEPSFGYFHSATRPSINDLLGVFEQFYIRSEDSWLCRPQTRNETDLRWSESFEFAVPFSSLANAQAMLSQLECSAWVLRSSCAFTAVVPVPERRGDPCPDGLASAVSAACEARDISSSLSATTDERFAAMESAPTRAKSPRL